MKVFVFVAAAVVDALLLTLIVHPCTPWDC